MPGTKGSSIASMAAFLSSTAPMPEANAPAAGTGGLASRNDHTHPRLTSAGAKPIFVLSASGEYTITFTRIFDPTNPPALIYSEINATDTPSTTFKTKQYTFDQDGNINGCVVVGKRRRALPTITPLSTGLTLILNLITALNVILASLSAYLPEENAAGVRFSYFAVQAS